MSSPPPTDAVPPLPRVIVVMGPAGCGKTTVGRRLAELFHAPFMDADDFHSPDCIEKMKTGQPLSDDDRKPWLQRLRALIDQVHEQHDGDPRGDEPDGDEPDGDELDGDETEKATGVRLVLACSALRESYRETLTDQRASVALVYPAVSQAKLCERLRRRPGHFFDPALLDSQLATLEMPAPQHVYDGELPVDELCTLICARLGRPKR